MSDESSITDLRNLGVKSESMLSDAGITTVERLREIGAVSAYVQIVATGAEPSMNLLWALEGALTGRSWQEVAKHDRLSLLMQLEQEQAQG